MYYHIFIIVLLSLYIRKCNLTIFDISDIQIIFIIFSSLILDIKNIYQSSSNSEYSDIGNK